ncbi:hypothetical protein [Dehalogenimonas sp. 4OHTPN]|uniref:SLATT domain-containing protein n=1 Tax=Dehalogenimonas sp. 4OHTPN TaxID=3166643 RepID=A0AAU8G7Y1_9CHLR
MSLFSISINPPQNPHQVLNDRYIQWFQSEIESQTAYHNHKETMSWVVTALYIPSILVAGNYIGEHNLSFLRNPCCFILALLLASVFVTMQFRSRHVSAKTIAALMELVNEIESGQLNLNDADSRQFVTIKFWPKFVDDRIHKWDGFKARSVFDLLFTDVVCLAGIVLATFLACYLASL